MTRLSVTQAVFGLLFVCVALAGVAFADLSAGQCHADLYLDLEAPPAASPYAFYCKNLGCPAPECGDPAAGPGGFTTCMCDYDNQCNVGIRAAGGGGFTVACVFDCDENQCSGEVNTDVGDCPWPFFDHKAVCWCH